jgi:hypothetical protein
LTLSSAEENSIEIGLMSVSASRVSYQGHMTPAWLFVGGWLGEPKLGRKDTRQESEMSVDRATNAHKAGLFETHAFRGGSGFVIVPEGTSRDLDVWLQHGADLALWPYQSTPQFSVISWVCNRG